MALVIHDCENLLSLPSLVLKHTDKSIKMEGDYHGHRWTTRFLRKEGVKLPDISRLSVVCGQKAPAYSSAHLGNELQQWLGNQKGGCP
jgi:hypothetical protein